MAHYTVKAGHNDADRAESARTFRTRPAAYNYAYRCWYEALGYLGGRDTAWGTLGAEVLNEWLRDREKLAAVAMDPHGTLVVLITTP